MIQCISKLNTKESITIGMNSNKTSIPTMTFKTMNSFKNSVFLKEQEQSHDKFLQSTQVLNDLSAKQRHNKPSEFHTLSNVVLKKMIKERKKNIIQNPHFSISEIITRKKLSRWILNIGKELNLLSVTTHKAVHYLDRIMHENGLEKEELKAICAIFILLAAKLFESESKVDEVILKAKSIINGRLFMLESQIMNFLQWNIQCITAIDFLEIFIDQGLIFNSAESKESDKKLSQLIEVLADLCIEEYEFIAADPLYLAVGIVKVARKLYLGKNAWSRELEIMGNCGIKDLNDYYDAIMGHCKNWIAGSKINPDIIKIELLS